MRRLRARDEERESKINLTPMLDVVFIMLIFFIVTATFVKEIGLDVNQPEDDTVQPVDPDKRSIVVRITSHDRILIAKRTVGHPLRAGEHRTPARGKSRGAGDHSASPGVHYGDD